MGGGGEVEVGGEGVGRVEIEGDALTVMFQSVSSELV